MQASNRCLDSFTRHLTWTGNCLLGAARLLCLTAAAAFGCICIWFHLHSLVQECRKLVLLRFWWHIVIVTHALVMVMIKTFLFNTFYQCPFALAFTFFLMGAQVTPIQSTLALNTLLLRMRACDWLLRLSWCRPMHGPLNRILWTSYKQLLIVHNLFFSFWDCCFRQVT